MKKTLTATTKRRNDFISLLAVFLFAVALAFELFMICWLPSMLNSAGRWEKEIALEEMVELQDLLRANMISARNSFKSISDEVDLAKGCLDDYARYLRKNKDMMNAEQINELYSRLIEFDQIYRRWKSGEGYSRERGDIDPSYFIQSQFYRL